MLISRTFFQQHHASKAIVQVPKVCAAHSSFIVEFSIYVESIVGRNFQFSHSITRYSTIAQWRIEVVGPRGPVAVSISIVVAQEVVSTGGFTPLYVKRLIDGGQKIFCEVWYESRDSIEVLGDVTGRKSAQEVPCIVLDSVQRSAQWAVWSSQSTVKLSVA